MDLLVVARMESEEMVGVGTVEGARAVVEVGRAQQVACQEAWVEPEDGLPAPAEEDAVMKQAEVASLESAVVVKVEAAAAVVVKVEAAAELVVRVA